jgi:mRNA-degrading endonuclease RelE of RelBE toxin-antitoxin system
MFQFTKYAEKKFLKLDKNAQAMIREKLVGIKESGNLWQLNTLKNFEPATHRLRVGDYRLILEQISTKEFIVLDVGHRRDIYK